MTQERSKSRSRSAPRQYIFKESKRHFMVDWNGNVEPCIELVVSKKKRQVEARPKKRSIYADRGFRTI